MISVANEMLYVLFGVCGLFFYLDNHHPLILLFLVLYILYLLRYRFKTLIILIIVGSIYLINYKLQLERLLKYDKDKIITCTVVSFPQEKEKYTQFYCKSRNFKYLVYDKSITNNMPLGTVIQLENNLQLVKNNTIPYQFNYRKYLLSQKIQYVNYVEDVKITRMNKRIDFKLINTLHSYYQDTPNKGYLLSFILGDKNALDNDFNEATQFLNISHLFVVSGFQVAFLYLVCHIMMKYLHITKETSKLISQIIIILFLIINCFSVSIFRAVMLIILIELKNKKHLPIDNIHILSIIWLINLLVNPFVMYNSGFVLSYLITLILFLSRIILMHKRSYIISIYRVNIICQLFALPITANFDFHFNVLSVLLTPLLSLYYIFVIFPFTLICLLIKPLSKLLYYGFSIFDQIILKLATITYFDLNVGVFTETRYIIYYVCLFFIFRMLENKKKPILLIILLTINISFYHKLILVDEVIFFDVGQGDSTFINAETYNCRALIDTGGARNYKPGNTTIKYLSSIQIAKLDYLFISHSDLDHANDVDVFVNNIKVKNIILSSYDNGELVESITRLAEQRSINIKRIHAYNKVECGKLTFFIIHPDHQYANSNDNSLIIFVHINGDNYLFTGDAKSDKILLGKEKTIDYLKISHHGSKYQTDDNLFKTVEIKNAIISVGINNYGHPSQEVLDILLKHNVKVYRTDVDGSIIIRYYLRFKRMKSFFRPIYQH